MLNDCLPTKTTTDINAKLYSKLVFNSVINAMAAVTNAPVGKALKTRKARRVVMGIIREGVAPVAADPRPVRAVPAHRAGGRLRQRAPVDAAVAGERQADGSGHHERVHLGEGPGTRRPDAGQRQPDRHHQGDRVGRPPALCQKPS